MAEHRELYGRTYIVGYQVEIRKGSGSGSKRWGRRASWLRSGSRGVSPWRSRAPCSWGSSGGSCRWASGCSGMARWVALTLADPHWDDVIVAQLTRRYKSLYEAG